MNFWKKQLEWTLEVGFFNFLLKNCEKIFHIPGVAEQLENVYKNEEKSNKIYCADKVAYEKNAFMVFNPEII